MTTIKKSKKYMCDNCGKREAKKGLRFCDNCDIRIMGSMF